MMDVHLVAGDKGDGAHMKLMPMETIKMGNMDVVITIVTNKYILAVPVNGTSILNWTMQKILKLLNVSMTQILVENGVLLLLHVNH